MHQRRRFHRAIRVDVEIPGETEIADIAVVDLVSGLKRCSS